MDLESTEKSTTCLTVGISDGFEKQKGEVTIMVSIYK